MTNHFSGHFLPGKSLLHRLDARAKLLAFFLLAAAVIAADAPAGYALLALALMALAAAGRLPPRALLAGLSRLWLLGATVFLMNALFFDSGEALWRWWIFTPSLAGAAQGARVLLRIVLIVLFSNLLTLTTPPMALTGAIRALLRPLQRLGLPAEDIAMILSAAIQFIPTLMHETDDIRMAQTARGARFESRRLRERAAAMLPLVVPVFLSAFRRADELATAMEARGYRGARFRTAKKRVPLPGSGWAALALCAGLCVIEIII